VPVDPDALALIELDAVARGLRVVDAMVKKAPVRVLEANLIEPGRFLILFSGGVAEVDEAFTEGLAIGEGCVLSQMMLPLVHPSVLAGLRGAELREGPDALDCLGVVEGAAVAPVLVACDRALKDADVRLVGLRVAGGLGGRAYFVLAGAQHDVEAALEAAEGALGPALHRLERIPRPHADMVPWLLRPAPFRVGPEVPWSSRG
jgi:microcompartment protein CcmL/EutN